MGIETTLLIASLAVAAASASMSFVESRQQAKAQQQMADENARAANEQAKLQYGEIQRQQEETNEIAQQQKSDRVRQANQELGTLNVLAGERGASGSTLGALATEVGYYEGLDISRIETSRKQNIASGEASKKAAQQGAINTINIAELQSKAAAKSVKFAGIGAGLQIAGSAVGSYSDYKTNQAYVNAAKNKVE